MNPSRSFQRSLAVLLAFLVSRVIYPLAGTAATTEPASAPVESALPAATAAAAPSSSGEPISPEQPQSSDSLDNPGATSLPNQEHVNFGAALSHAAYSQSAPTQLLFKVEFSCADRQPAERKPLNLALVLDRSASMADDMKFPHALAAARAIIDNLTDRDLISLVAFNERVLVLSPSGRAVNKPFLLHRLSDISPEGTTDLSAGLLEGIAQVSSQSAAGQIQHVLLLTDGQANTGITDPAALRKISETAHAKGIGLSTLGCGTDFNERLLTDLATAGGGRYTYVKSAEQLPAAFRDELHGLLKVVAQNVRLEITLNQAGTIRKVYGQPWQPASPAYQLQIGNLRAGEHGFVMMALQPTSFQAGARLEVSAKLTYDAPESSQRIVRTADIRAEFTLEGRGARLNENEELLLCGAVMDTLDLAASALESYDLNRYAAARASFDQWHERVRQYALAHQNQDLLSEAFLLKHFMEELEAIRRPGVAPLMGDIQASVQKQADFQHYQLVHHEVGQNDPTSKYQP